MPLTIPPAAGRGYEERRDATGEFVEEVVVNGVFDVVVDMAAT